MKVKCKKTLYWHQAPGYSGSFSRKKQDSERTGELAFSRGRTYKAIIRPYKTSTGLEYIALYLIGEKGRIYKILQNELNYRATDFALDHFNFK